MKKIITPAFLALFIGSYSLAQSYQITKTSDQNQSFMIFNIKSNEQDVAKLCVFDPKKTFDFYSKQSDPKYFACDIETQINEFAKEKKNSKPMCIILGKFTESKKNVKKIYPGYFWESMALLFIMPAYFDNINIINTKPTASRFYLKVYIGEKYYYSLLVSNNPICVEEAKKYFRAVKQLDLDHKIKPVPIDDFPVKLISFDSGRARTIYTSDNNIEKYDCMFMAVVK